MNILSSFTHQDVVPIMYFVIKKGFNEGTNYNPMMHGKIYKIFK